MGNNCFRGRQSDDVSLLRGAERDSTSSDLNQQDIYQEPNVPVYYPSPNVRRPVNELTEAEQVKIAKRLGMIQHLPSGTYECAHLSKSRECIICMIEFGTGDKVRYLPCMHVYHVQCIDQWLSRSFTCPACMQPVDAALFTTTDTSLPINGNSSR